MYLCRSQDQFHGEIPDMVCEHVGDDIARELQGIACVFRVAKRLKNLTSTLQHFIQHKYVVMSVPGQLLFLGADTSGQARESRSKIVVLDFPNTIKKLNFATS